MLYEFDGDNNILARYTASGLAIDDVLSVRISSNGVSAKLAQNSGSYLYLKDTTGSVTDITNTAGTRIQHMIYSAFGMLLGIQDASAADISSNPVLNTSIAYSGRELDSESGLMYYRARHYDPSIGRFLQQDPHPGSIAVPMSTVNPYIYSANNPWNLSDPSGMTWLGDFITGIAIGIAAVIAAVLIVPLIIGALGGAAALGSIGSIVVGAVSGAMAGAAAGILVGGISNVIQGRNFGDNLLANALSGAIAGFMAGATIGYNATGVSWNPSGDSLSYKHGFYVEPLPKMLTEEWLENLLFNKYPSYWKPHRSIKIYDYIYPNIA